MSPNGRVVTAERLAGLEGGGSLSTLWYYGSDGDFHYFRHLWKSSIPYRVKQDEFEWEPPIRFVGYTDGKLIRHEMSEHVLSAQEIEILDKTYHGSVFEILASRKGKDSHEKWRVDTHQGLIRICKSRTDGKILPSGSAVEFWSEDDKGYWIPNPTA